MVDTLHPVDTVDTLHPVDTVGAAERRQIR
jgi:hypothetical protein